MVDDDVRVVKVYEDHKADPDEVVAMDNEETGEVIISSPAKSPYKYYDNEEETRNKYYKGFIYTGDLATWDKHQYITILGRKDDMIISSGENIYPTEIEEVLNKHPKVADSIVTYVHDKIRGQVVTAYVVRKDKSLTPRTLMPSVRSHRISPTSSVRVSIVSLSRFRAMRRVRNSMSASRRLPRMILLTDFCIECKTIFGIFRKLLEAFGRPEVRNFRTSK